MKRGIAFVVAVASCSVLGQGLLRRTGTKAGGKPGRTAEAVRDERKAQESATREACEKFGVAIEPDGWTNGCGKGVLVFGADGKCYKYDRDGRLLRFGNARDFEELV